MESVNVSDSSKSEIKKRHRNTASEVVPEDPKLFIDGDWKQSVSGDSFKTSDPTTGETLAEIPAGQSADIDLAVEAASEAQAEWSETTARERQQLLQAVAERIGEHEAELSKLISLDNGKPITEAKWDVDGIIDTLNYFAAATRTEEDQIPTTTSNKHVEAIQEPLGVVGLIVPWNFPVATAMWKVAPAIATGNTVVLKPAEETPLPILYTLDLIDDIIPDGLVNVVTGFGTEAGQALVAHSNVRKISFTGSTKVGKEVMRMSADNVKDITLELGGKSPLIVFPDVDVQSAAETASNAIFFNTGEVCTAGSRLFVHSDIAERFINAFEEEASSLTVGDPLLEDTDLGPKVSEQQKERTLEYIEEAKDSDAKCLFGGKAPESEALSDGCFVLPTAFSDIDHDSRPVQEEIFGPVEMVFTWSDYDSMMELANDTEYGLAGGILSGDEGKARKAADDLEAGTIWVNQYGDFSLGMPFGGYKQSGIGRETSLEALQEYTQTKSVNFKLDQ